MQKTSPPFFIFGEAGVFNFLCALFFILLFHVFVNAQNQQERFFTADAPFFETVLLQKISIHP
jgi:hypothetical protein